MSGAEMPGQEVSERKGEFGGGGALLLRDTLENGNVGRSP